MRFLATQQILATVIFGNAVALCAVCLSVAFRLQTIYEAW